MVSNAPYAWTATALTTSTGGTQRQRADGSRPSGKYRRSRAKVASTHQAFSAVTATSQAQSRGEPSAASHRSQTSFATTCATLRESRPSSTPTTAPSGRRATRTDRPLAIDTTTTPSASATQDAGARRRDGEPEREHQVQGGEQRDRDGGTARPRHGSTVGTAGAARFRTSTGPDPGARHDPAGGPFFLPSAHDHHLALVHLRHHDHRPAATARIRVVAGALALAALTVAGLLAHHALGRPLRQQRRRGARLRRRWPPSATAPGPACWPTASPSRVLGLTLGLVVCHLARGRGRVAALVGAVLTTAGGILFAMGGLAFATLTWFASGIAEDVRTVAGRLRQRPPRPPARRHDGRLPPLHGRRAGAGDRAVPGPRRPGGRPGGVRRARRRPVRPAVRSRARLSCRSDDGADRGAGASRCSVGPRPEAHALRTRRRPRSRRTPSSPGTARCGPRRWRAGTCRRTAPTTRAPRRRPAARRGWRGPGP